MKKYVALSLALGFLTGCSSQPSTETPPPFEWDASSETEAIPQEEAIDLTAYAVDPEALFIEHGPGLAYFETKPYLSVGTPLTVNVAESRYDGTTPDPLFAEVTLQKAEVFADHEGSGRLGIRLVFEEKNMNETSIEVGDGFTAKNSATQLAVFYGETQLKTHQTNVINTPDTEAYLTAQHLSYVASDGSVTCSTNQTLEAGESRTCHEVVSFAGTGNYLVNVAVDPEQDQYQTYVVTVE